jgi:hypothetical protein
MWPAAAALVAMTLAIPPAERVLACRSRITGDPALARGEALAEGLRQVSGRVLDYGVPCESPAEAARAARRAGLAHAVFATVEGRTDGSLVELTVVDADGRVLAVRRHAIAPGGEIVRTISASLDGLVAELPRPQTRRARRRAAIGVAGGGLALLAAGVALAATARGEADRANAATAPEEFTGARRSWERARGWSGAVLGIGSAALAAGVAWRIDLQRED